jgi:hypothetical protein
MKPTPKVHSMRNPMKMIGMALAIAGAAAMMQAGNAATVAGGVAKMFATPDAVFQALADAAKANDEKAAAAIFGADGARILNSGDPVRDKNARARFAAAYAQKHAVNMKGNAQAELVVGNDEWPCPVPAVKVAGGWALDSAAGAREIVARRIGENELDAIATVRAIADAQFDYSGAPRVGNVAQYARKFVSSTRKKDGLYWKTKAGEPDSPLGPLVASATREGYGKSTPFHGYRFRILLSQGKSAKGGARSYVVGGNMIGGFGVLAYPAVYGDTGIMSFIVNQDGVVYEKDLGKHTPEVGPKVSTFDQDETWKAVN